VVNRSIEKILRSLSGEKPGQWDLILAQVEFAYKYFVNRSVGKSPYQIIYGRSLKGVVDLFKFPNLEDKRSIDASEIAERMRKCMSRLRESYNKEIQSIKKE
jgi:hypothetical protein